MGTIGDRLSQSQHASGFDDMRIALVIGVMCIHSFAASYGKSGEGFLFAFPLRSCVMLVLFLYGMLLYRCRHRLAYSRGIAALCFAAGSVALYFPLGI